MADKKKIPSELKIKNYIKSCNSPSTKQQGRRMTNAEFISQFCPKCTRKNCVNYVANEES